MSITPQPPGSRLDPEPVPRRDFLGLAALTSAGTALLFAALGMMRLPKAAVLPTPARKFRISIPDSLKPGEAFVPPGRSVAIFRDGGEVWAVSTICTHLGCVVKAGAEGFECPCHGSRFSKDGAVTKGPAPRSLPWVKLSAGGGAFVVDEESTVPPGTKVKA